MIRITDAIALHDDELQFAATRASGPGGQNVNKVSSAIELRFDARGSPNLPDAVAARALRLAGARATKDGVIVIQASRFRDQPRNREDAIARLVALIVRAAETPKPRRPTRPTKASVEKRIHAKTKRGALKAGRRAQGED
jgi:ribosome-associated protein